MNDRKLSAGEFVKLKTADEMDAYLISFRRDHNLFDWPDADLWCRLHTHYVWMREYEAKEKEQGKKYCHPIVFWMAGSEGTKCDIEGLVVNHYFKVKDNLPHPVIDKIREMGMNPIYWGTALADDCRIYFLEPSPLNTPSPEHEDKK